MRISFYAMNLMVSLEREPKLRKGTRQAVLELRMEGCRDTFFKVMRLADDPCCPTCGEPGQPICWCSVIKGNSVEYNCPECVSFFWSEDPLGRTKKLRRGRAFTSVQLADVHPVKAKSK